MKRYLRWFLLVAIAVMPLAFAACDDDEGGEGPPEEITGTIRGTVTAEGQGLSGVTVNLSGPTSSTTQTGSDGSYTFSNVPDGTYSVDIGAVSNAVFSTSSKVVVIQTQDQVATVNFQGQFLRNSRIEGVVTARGSAVSGVTVTLSGAGSGSTLTNSSGSFTFENLAAGDYTVEISDFPSSISFSTTSKSVTLGTGESQAVTFSGTAPPSASVSIQSITSTTTNNPVNPDNVANQIDITVNLDPDDEEITSVQLMVDGEVVREQTFSSGSSGAEGAPSQVEEIVFSINTAETAVPMDQWDGTQIDGRWSNGAHTVAARANTDQGDFVETGGTDLTFNNESFLTVHPISPDQSESIVSGGVRWWGGQDITVAVTPVIFDAGLSIGEVTVHPETDATTANAAAAGDGSGDADIGAGQGATASADAQPFQFTVAFDDNLGQVEDDPADPNFGHDFVIVSIFDDQGVNISSDFGPGQRNDLEDFFMDFVGPNTDDGGASEVAIDGTAANGQFFSEGDFTVSNTSELGVGGTNLDFQVEEQSDGDTIFTSVAGIADVDEHSVDLFTRLTSIADDLGNVSDETTVDVSGTANGGAAYGVDRTMPTPANALPDADIVFKGDATDADANGNVFYDAGAGEPEKNVVLWDVSDPDIVFQDDTTAGSGVNYASVSALVIEADDDSTTYTMADAQMTADVNGDATMGDFGLDVSAHDEGALIVEVTLPDNAVSANDGSQGFGFTLDISAPTFGTLNPIPQGSGGTQAGSLVESIGGDVSDANIIAASSLNVRVDGTDAQGAGPNAVCEGGSAATPDYLLDTSAGEIDQNEVDLTDGTESFSFSEDFTLTDPFPSGTGTVTYCYFVTATDEALNNLANADGNSADLNTQADVTWQN